MEWCEVVDLHLMKETSLTGSSPGFVVAARQRLQRVGAARQGERAMSREDSTVEYDMDPNLLYREFQDEPNSQVG